MRPEQIARLQRLARLRETRARAMLGKAVRERARLEAERHELTVYLSGATAPDGADAGHYQSAARLDRAFRQGLDAYRRAVPERDAAIARSRADYARALGQLQALAELRHSAETAARRKREAREEEQRDTAARTPPALGPDS